jgi:hypothetical protein
MSVDMVCLQPGGVNRQQIVFAMTGLDPAIPASEARAQGSSGRRIRAAQG